MILSVTTLGSRHGDAAGAATKVVRYLDGRGRCPGGRDPQPLPELAAVDPTSGIVGYYADSVEGPGRWLGRGVATVSPTGVVDPEHLRAVLVGKDPLTGEPLLAPRGSAARATQAGPHHDGVDRHADPTDCLSLNQAASILGVTPRYLRRLAVDTERLRQRQAAQRAAGEEVEPTPRSYLDGTHDGCNAHWSLSQAEVARFAAERQAPAAVVGYDLTFSVPKSVSIAWATADAPRQAQITAAIDQAVNAGIDYLQDHAAYVQRAPGPNYQGPRREKAMGLLAASYTHATSRCLDPQLHCHVVVANLARRADGAVRALDGRPLFAHAKTAGYLAAAELRHQLAQRLGFEWGPVERGVADIVGVPRAAIAEMSQRSVAMDAFMAAATQNLSDELAARWRDSATARQMTAYETRAAKEAVDPAALRPHWAARLEGVGFGPDAAAACYDRQAAVALVTAEERAELLQRLGSATGVTHMAATFDRRDVVQYVAQWSGDRLSPAEICDLADTWLATDVVVGLDVDRRDGRAGDVIRRGDGRVVSAVDDDALYTTRSMLDVEQRIWAAYDRGRGVGAGVVVASTVESALADRPELGADQAGMVAAITTSGHRIQCVMGQAGAGKTRALEAAARAWEAAGYATVGAAVGGTAAEVLEASTGVASTTVASLLTRLDVGQGASLDARTVVLVDEASTLANRDLARLTAHVERAGATMRLLGDPAQHTAVAAGGAWRSLLERHPDDTPVLVTLRRQQGPEMEQVRLALGAYRQGKVAEALERLGADNRLVECASPDEVFDTLAADWYVDRQRRAANPELAASSMIAEHHHERAELNRRARTLLANDGELRGPTLNTGDAVFQAGDEVIARARDASLRPEGGDRRSAVTNGLRGRVLEVRAATPEGLEPDLVVDFERRGPVVVPYAALTRPLRPGVVGVLAHSYAVTSHAAEGDTYEAARHLGTERSTRPGVYVGLSRGRSDSRLYLVRKADVSPDRHLELPRLDAQTTLLEAVTARLTAERHEGLASEVDPDAAEVARLRAALSVTELRRASVIDGAHGELARRALNQQLTAVATAARLDPGPAMTARLGPRPVDGDQRAVWDRGVGEAARYRAAYDVGALDPHASGGAWALGPRPDGPVAQDYDRVVDLIATVELAYATRLPTAELAREHRNLTNTLALDPAHRHLDAAIGAAVVAAERLAQAHQDLERAHDRVGVLEAAPRRHRNPQGIELARRSVAVAERAMAQADLVATNASQRVEAAQVGADAQRPVQDLLNLVEGALDAQVDAAVANPAPYLSAALGPVPAPGPDRDAWAQSATAVEAYRHRELGLAPADGALSADDPLVAAIGAEPDDFATALLWRAAAARIAADELAVDVVAPDFGIDL